MKDYEGNNDTYRNIINDFITELQYLNKLKKEDVDNNVKGDSIIYEVNEKLSNNMSKEFLTIFKDKKELTVNKIYELFEYYLKLINEYIKKEIKEYQEKLGEEKKEKLNNYYKELKNEEGSNIKKHIINKEDFATSIRLFMALVLFREEDKKNKIKENRKNIVNYLKVPDLWDYEIYVNEKFIENLNKLKSFNIQINQILELYNLLVEDNENNFTEKVETTFSFFKQSKRH